MAIITISRQYGSQGDEIAHQVCEKLGYRYFDKRVIEQIASSMGLAEGEWIDVAEEAYHHQIGKNLLNRIRCLPVANILQTMMTPSEKKFVMAANWAEDATGASVKQVRWLSEQEERLFIRDVILNAYQQGDFVIVGRGGQIILKEKPGVLHVRIIAPEDTRATYLAMQQHLQFETARTLIHEHDRAAAHYIKTWHQADWDDPLLYHLSINTAVSTRDAAVQTILAAAQRLSEGKPSGYERGCRQRVWERLQPQPARITF